MGHPPWAAREAQETQIIRRWKWQISRDQHSGEDRVEATSQVSCWELLHCDAISPRPADGALTYCICACKCTVSSLFLKKGGAIVFHSSITFEKERGQKTKIFSQAPPKHVPPGKGETPTCCETLHTHRHAFITITGFWGSNPLRVFPSNFSTFLPALLCVLPLWTCYWFFAGLTIMVVRWSQWAGLP